MQQHFI